MRTLVSPPHLTAARNARALPPRTSLLLAGAASLLLWGVIALIVSFF